MPVYIVIAWPPNVYSWFSNIISINYLFSITQKSVDETVLDTDVEHLEWLYFGSAKTYRKYGIIAFIWN